MQKDIHYYATFALAVKVGIDFVDAKAIAWANQFTDDCKSFEKYGFRTMVDIAWKSSDCFVPEVQRTVFVPFHFLPGNREDLTVVCNSEISKMLLDNAIRYGDKFGLGIALHSFQDTYSHEKFTGTEDQRNAKHSWIAGLIPNIGHADYGVDPDIVYDEHKIDHRTRTQIALEGTLNWLITFRGTCDPINMSDLDAFWKISNYETRKKWLFDWAGINQAHRYNSYSPPNYYIRQFIDAAKKQQAFVLSYLTGT